MPDKSSTLTGPKPYLNPYLAGSVLGVVLFLAFFITGSGLGASGGLNRMVVYVQNIIAPEHIDQVPYLLKMAGGKTNPLDSWIVYLTAGTLVGGFISGLFGRRIRLETNKGPRIGNKTRWMMAFLGGAEKRVSNCPDRAREGRPVDEGKAHFFRGGFSGRLTRDVF